MEQRSDSSLLFTAFEPSGDALAAPVIAEIRKRVPEMRIYAWGGPLMEAAGASLVEHTTGHAAMGLGGLANVRRVQKSIAAIKRWSNEYRVLAHMAVDSPAANFPICKLMRKHGARVVHLAAPQLWAWGSWRAGKLKRRTDLVCCLLPFEEPWFESRGIPARFVGHHAINRELNRDRLSELENGLPHGSPRIAIFPGSRPQEVKQNMRLLTNTFVELRARHNALAAVVVAASPDLVPLIKKKIGVMPTGLNVVSGQPELAIHWCDMALAVSGTVSLDITRQRKPMIGVYKTGFISWLGAKVLLRTPFRLLPNIIAEHEVVPEYVPYIGGAGPLVTEASTILGDSREAAKIKEGLTQVCAQYVGHDPARESAKLILELIKTGRVPSKRVVAPTAREQADATTPEPASTGSPS